VTGDWPIAGVIAALRCGVGASLIAKPHIATSGDGGRTVLVRTIGVRDLVLGAGTLAALRQGHAQTWSLAGLFSDVADSIVALASRRQLGARGTLVAAVAPLPFVVAVSCTRPWRRRSLRST
jgi:hypothetical protein